MVVTANMGKGPDRVGAQAGEAAIVSRIVGEVRRADEKLVTVVQERPIAALCAAAVVGYLIGRVITRVS